MTPVSPLPVEATSDRRKHRAPRPGQRALRFLAEWWDEILVGLLVAFGLFLVVEPWHIRQTLLGWLELGLSFASQLEGNLRQSVAELIRRTTLSDLVGYAMLLVAAALVVWRTRHRLVTLPRLTERKCPWCGGALHRIHRRSVDRLINVFVPVRRYRCDNHDCRWRGLRVGKSWEE